MSVCSQWGSRVTIARDALDLTVQGPQPYPRFHSQALVPLWTWDLTVQGPQPYPRFHSQALVPLWTWDLTVQGHNAPNYPQSQKPGRGTCTGDMFKVSTSGAQDWKLVQACSPDIWKHIWSAQAGGTYPTAMLSCLICGMEIMYEDVYHDSMIDQF